MTRSRSSWAPVRAVGRELPGVPADVGPVAVAVDVAVAALAARQYGVVTRAQLRALGLSDSAISGRAATGRLHRVHRGVYAVGHPLLPARGAWMAAVLACGRGAVLSHASAGALWDLRQTASAAIDVTVHRSGRAARHRLRVHRPYALRGDEVTVRHGIPVTTAARTILDLAEVLRERPLERVLDQAEQQRLTDVRSLLALARTRPTHRGARRLLGALATHTPGTTITRSGLEERFLALCRAHAFPVPRVNHRVEGFEVDFLFAAERVVVETDSWRFHGDRESFESDRARDAILAGAGYRTLRFTDDQLTRGAPGVVRALQAVLARGPGDRLP